MIDNAQKKNEDFYSVSFDGVKEAPEIGKLCPIEVGDALLLECPGDKFFSDRVAELWILFQEGNDSFDRFDEGTRLLVFSFFEFEKALFCLSSEEDTGFFSGEYVRPLLILRAYF